MLPCNRQWTITSDILLLIMMGHQLCFTCKKYDILHTRGTDIFYLIIDHQWQVLTRYSSFWGDPSCLLRVWSPIVLIRVTTKLPNSEQSYKGKVKTHNYITRQNQSTTGKLKTVMTLTWYRHFYRNGGLNQILKRQTSRSHYGSKVPAVTITVFKYRNKIGKLVVKAVRYSVK